MTKDQIAKVREARQLAAITFTRARNLNRAIDYVLHFGDPKVVSPERFAEALADLDSAMDVLKNSTDKAKALAGVRKPF